MKAGGGVPHLQGENTLKVPLSHSGNDARQMAPAEHRVRFELTGHHQYSTEKEQS